MTTRPTANAPPSPAPYRSLATSPWLSVPEKRFVCVEHPARARNLNNVIATLGGEKALAELAASNGASGLSLRFRPDDVMQPPIESRTTPTNNVLLKITIPRRRRKNKENRPNGGTSNVSEPGWDNKQLLGKLRASRGNYEIEALGMIERTVRFRDMANYQWNTSRSPFVNMMSETIVGCNYHDILNFKLGPARGVQPDLDILPPPAFSNTYIPHAYNYRQNPAIKKAVIGGERTLVNVQAAPKTLTPIVRMSQSMVPPCPPISDQGLDSMTKKCLEHLHNCFRERPIWSRRALFNHLPREHHPQVRFAMVHVAYMFRSGPWKDTCVVYGLDPRKDPQYRKYQSIQFQLEREVNPVTNKWDKTAHIFDGQSAFRGGRCLQLVDITDPLLDRLINTESIRTECDYIYGWYRASTMTKIKKLMKAKYKALAQKRPAPDSEYLSILEEESEDEETEKKRREEEKARSTHKQSARKLGIMKKRHGLYEDKSDKAGRAESETTQGASRDDAEEDEDEDEDEGEDEDVQREWDEELDVDLTFRGPRGVDGRVQELMSQYMDRSGEAQIGFEDEDTGEFDLLGEDGDNEH